MTYRLTLLNLTAPSIELEQSAALAKGPTVGTDPVLALAAPLATVYARPEFASPEEELIHRAMNDLPIDFGTEIDFSGERDPARKARIKKRLADERVGDINGPWTDCCAGFDEKEVDLRKAARKELTYRLLARGLTVAEVAAKTEQLHSEVVAFKARYRL